MLEKQTPLKQPVDYFKDISGLNDYGHPKARVMIRRYTVFSDGTQTENGAYIVEKPIVKIYAQPRFVTIRLDFEQSIDLDLKDFWELLEDFFDPMNSVSYSDDELESGVYTDDTGEHMVYFPMLDLVLSPIGRETEYVIGAVNPVLKGLSPNSPDNLDPCVLNLVFSEDCVSINDTPDLDLDEIQHQAVQDLGLDPNHPNYEE